MATYPGLAFSESEGRLQVAVQPAADRPPADAESLRTLVAQAGWAGWFVFEEALAAVVARYSTAGEAFELPIAERRDGSLSLEVSADALVAWVDFVPAYGGEAVSPDDIFGALGAAGVTIGIDELAIEAICGQAVPGRIAAATGVPAENGRDVVFELLAPDTRDRTPKVDKNGFIDFRELGAIPMVLADQPLMRRIPPTNGTPGHNVHGEVLEPQPGRNEGFAENLIGAYPDPNDANLLLAVFSGQPVRCGNGVSVEQVLRVREVNIASGNISFDGTVQVDGEVLPGMKVQATGDIIVSGVVDGGVLDAGGDVRIGGGIIAKASVRAGGSVAARFVESAQVYAGTAIVIEDTALQSDLQAINQILVGVKAPQRGRLAGGSVRAMLLIRVPLLGAATGGVTSIQLGVNPVLEAQYQNLLQRIEKQRAEEANLEKLIKHLSTQGDKGGMLERVKASWQQAVQAWAKLLPEKEALEDQLALIAGARLEIGVGVSGAVDMSFGKKSLRLRRNFDGGAFSVEGEKILFTGPDGHSTVAG